MSSGRPRHRGGRHGNTGRRHAGHTERCPEPAEPAADDSPLVTMFRGFAARLDSKHDRYERLVKKSRDVTIESKRIIFMLHRVTKDEQSQPLLEEAAERFRQLEASTLREIAEELVGQDPYLFIRAISPGLQEYIEALSFYHYLLQDRLITWAEAQARLTYLLNADAPSKAGDAPVGPAAETQTAEPPVGTAGATSTEPAAKEVQPELAESVPPPEQTATDADDSGKAGELQLQLLLPYHEYVLGLADLTGELMRKCISSVSSGELEQCWRLCGVLRTIHEGFINIGNTGPREITRKLQTLRQSLGKVENACYQLKVRGEEIPKHMLADVFSTGDDYSARDDYAGD